VIDSREAICGFPLQVPAKHIAKKCALSMRLRPSLIFMFFKVLFPPSNVARLPLPSVSGRSIGIRALSSLGYIQKEPSHPTTFVLGRLIKVIRRASSRSWASPLLVSLLLVDKDHAHLAREIVVDFIKKHHVKHTGSSGCSLWTSLYATTVTTRPVVIGYPHPIAEIRWINKWRTCGFLDS